MHPIRVQKPASAGTLLSYSAGMAIMQTGTELHTTIVPTLRCNGSRSRALAGSVRQSDGAHFSSHGRKRFVSKPLNGLQSFAYVFPSSVVVDDAQSKGKFSLGKS